MSIGLSAALSWLLATLVAAISAKKCSYPAEYAPVSAARSVPARSRPGLRVSSTPIHLRPSGLLRKSLIAAASAPLQGIPGGFMKLLVVLRPLDRCRYP